MRRMGSLDRGAEGSRRPQIAGSHATVLNWLNLFRNAPTAGRLRRPRPQRGVSRRIYRQRRLFASTARSAAPQLTMRLPRHRAGHCTTTTASVLTAPVAGNTVDNIAVEVATVIACITEFGVRDGRDDDRKRLLTELFVDSTAYRLPVQGNIRRCGPPRAARDDSYWTTPMRCAAGCAMKRMSARSIWANAKSSDTIISRSRPSIARRIGPHQPR